MAKSILSVIQNATWYPTEDNIMEARIYLYYLKNEHILDLQTYRVCMGLLESLERSNDINSENGENENE